MEVWLTKLFAYVKKQEPLVVIMCYIYIKILSSSYIVRYTMSDYGFFINKSKHLQNYYISKWNVFEEAHL